MYLLKPGRWLLPALISENKLRVLWLERISSNNILKWSRSVMLHSAKSAFMFTMIQPRKYTGETIQSKKKF